MYPIKGKALVLGFVLLIATSVTSYPVAPEKKKRDPSSFEVTFPRYRYRTLVGSLRKVDFRAFTFHILDARGKIEFTANLKDGKFIKREPYLLNEVGLESVHYVPPKEGRPEREIVILHWWSTGASLSGYGVVQVLELASGHPIVAQQIFFIQKAVGSRATYDAAKDTLTVRATHYTVSDPHCCPSKLDILTFALTESGFVRKRSKTVALKNNRIAGEGMSEP